MSYNIADGDLWWGIGYLILDKDDPTKILQVCPPPLSGQSHSSGCMPTAPRLPQLGRSDHD